jgi:hypothetical protein
VVLNPVCIAGIGAVSPAGWNVNSLRDALAKGQPLPTKELSRSGWRTPQKLRPVPPAVPRPEFLGHARLRRASPISQFAVGAALEALGPDVPRVRDGSIRLGILFCVMAGCVSYSRRFYDEALRDPATASPLVFPETVFNAPASHLAALLGSSATTCTLVGDSSMFLIALALAGGWLADARADAVLVVGAEESDWLISDAFRRFDRKAVLAEGAGAVYLKASSPPAASVRLASVTDAYPILSGRSRAQAALCMRAELPPGHPNDLLCESTQHLARPDSAERAAWAHWPGARLAPKLVLGEGLAAASAWQCVAAIDSLRQNRYASALVSVVGINQHAIGAAFEPA